MTRARNSSCAVVILTLNEENDIVAAIESVDGWADEVVIVDSGSEDATVERARAKGARVVRNEQDGPFRITDQRNWALTTIPFDSPWVLFLDADERATPEFLEAVQLAVQDESRDGFFAAPRFIYQGTWLRRYSGFPNWHPRLARVGACRFVGGVWEQFEPGTKAGHIAEPYVHIVDSKGLADWVVKHLRYAEWEAGLRRAENFERRNGLRKFARRLGSMRPIAALGYHLVLRGGILDGGSVWSYARRQLIYELLIAESRRERLRRDSGLPL